MIIASEAINAQSYIDATPDELRNYLLITLQHAADLTTDNQWLATNNRQLRERNAELEEQNLVPPTEEAQQLYRRVDELEKENQQLRDQQYKHSSKVFDWLKKLLTNTTIPAGCKITYIYLYILFSFMRQTIIDDELQVSLSQIAQATGQSTSAIADHLKRASTHDLLTRHDIKQETGEGETRTIVHLTLHEAILDPEHINLEKAQGGKRQKGCRLDGTPLDNYTVRHCPTHGEISIYRQPGTRKEADEMVMVDDIIRKYHNRVPNALEHTPHKKQDAFEDDQHQAEQIAKLSHQIDTAINHTEQVRINREEGQKQDAFVEQHTSSPTVDEATEQEYQRYTAAIQLVGQLSDYGLELEYLANGLRNLKRTGHAVSTPTKAIIDSLKEQILECDRELRDLMATTSQQKQDANAPQPIAQVVVDVPQQTLSPNPLDNDQQKQDAFDEYPEQLAAQHITLPSTASCFQEIPVAICHRIEPLNTKSESAHALEKITGSRQCGSTHWYWSDSEHAYLCRECNSPLNPSDW